MRVGERAGTIDVPRGVKQGSPTPFLAYMALLCYELDRKFHAEWCYQHLSVFADDTRGAWKIASAGDLSCDLNELTQVMAQFEATGMVLGDPPFQKHTTPNPH